MQEWRPEWQSKTQNEQKHQKYLNSGKHDGNLLYFLMTATQLCYVQAQGLPKRRFPTFPAPKTFEQQIICCRDEPCPKS